MVAPASTSSTAAPHRLVPPQLPPPPPTSGPGPSTLAAMHAGADSAASPPLPPHWPEDLGGPHARRRAAIHELLSLHVRQQPERARLCSYKEENDTIDPPPVLELRAHTTPGASHDILDSACFFIRASLVEADSLAAVKTDGASGDGRSELEYETVTMPGGGDATAGEIIQTPERLKDMEGDTAFMCIFAKLSVRLPGVFRLRFTLFETADGGVIEITQTVSEAFEVFSPKLFKGMHESTKLTRHLAGQGLKVKLRTDPSSGKQARRRSQAGRDTPADSPAPPTSSKPRLPSLVWPAGDRARAAPSASATPDGSDGAWPDESDDRRKLRRLMGRDDGYLVHTQALLSPGISTPSSDGARTSTSRAPSRTSSRDGARARQPPPTSRPQAPLPSRRPPIAHAPAPNMDLSGYSLESSRAGAGEPQRGRSSRSAATSGSTNPSLLSLQSAGRSTPGSQTPPTMSSTPTRYSSNRFGLPAGDDGLGILPLPSINSLALDRTSLDGWSVGHSGPPPFSLPPLSDIMAERLRADRARADRARADGHAHATPRSQPPTADTRPVLPPLHFLGSMPPPSHDGGRDSGFAHR